MAQPKLTDPRFCEPCLREAMQMALAGGKAPEAVAAQIGVSPEWVKANAGGKQ